ncbi:potassium voltage-gated channel subfamily V member 1 [Pleuronectes platessa]|uniref:potassium voltage-gated channel subfamily V member 1 n=1 Tax=Pleuronectes platessa TaxID=8262 RepID=UPI00232A2494|nr:potassium voltage-gated channel subfamily V member 1 [Pleuronectes platessa]
MSFPSRSVAAAELYGDSTSPLSLDSSVFFSETTASCVRDVDVFIINVGGSRYSLTQELLASHPETRLGRLASCSRDSALELCDDADLLDNEFFFDRNSQTFQYVMNFYRTGHLHVREELCEVSFLQEIEYWGIEDVRIHPCCRERYYRRKEQKESFDVQGEFEAEADEEDFIGAVLPALRRRLWDLLEKPDSSRAARTFSSLSILLVGLSLINMVLISLDFGEDVGVRDEGVSAPLLFDALEYVCVVWFTGELALRFLCVRDKFRFSQNVLNVIDLLAILPFYVTLAVESLHGGTSELENMGRVVQVLRLLRSLRMLKLGRHSTGKHGSMPFTL